MMHKALIPTQHIHAFKVGYDAKTGSGWTVGGQVSYLRGHDDYVFNGSGKEKAFAVGAYGLKDLGRDQYIQLDPKLVV